MTPPVEEYARKIAGLLRKAERTDSPQEAEALSAKAEELMLKWGIDDALLAAARGEDKPPEEIVKRQHKAKGRYHQAHMMLAHNIARGLGNVRMLKMNSTESHTTYVYFVGHESDVDRAEMLWNSLWLQASTALDVWWRTYDQRRYLGKADVFKARRQFLFSFGSAVQGRLTERRLMAEADAEVSTPGTALVLLDRGKQVDVWMTSHMRVSKSRGRAFAGTYAGREAGRAAGQRANLGDTALGNRKGIGR